MAFEKVFGEIEAHVGVIDFGTGIDLLAVFGVARFPEITRGGRVSDEFFETPLAGGLAHLPPFAGHGGFVAGLFEGARQGRLVLGLGIMGRLIGKAAGAKAVTAGHDLTTRRSAERGGISALETDPGFRQGIDVRGFVFEPIGAVAIEPFDAEIIAEKENDVGARRFFSRGGSGNSRDEQRQSK
jgi:hypothetical protein